MQTHRAKRDETKAEAQMESPVERGSFLQWVSFTVVTFCVAFYWFSQFTPAIVVKLVSTGSPPPPLGTPPDAVQSAASHALLVTFGAAVGVDSHRLAAVNQALAG